MTFNPNTYHRKSIRLKEYDYSQEGAYFVTICTKDRECLFGKIENEKIILSPVGVIADILWYEIKSHFPNVELGEFVVMPNHIHGVIIITENQNTNRNVGALHATPNPNNDNQSRALHATPLQNSVSDKNEYMSSISPKSGTLSSIIRSYKSAVSKHAHRLEFYFEWQRNYHEHIIRNEQSFQKISEYIMNNPARWADDKFYVA
ncbi:MAG TPA: transposase [Chitinophagales bacterium]